MQYVQKSRLCVQVPLVEALRLFEAKINTINTLNVSTYDQTAWNMGKHSFHRGRLTHTHLFESPLSWYIKELNDNVHEGVTSQQRDEDKGPLNKKRRESSPSQPAPR